MKKMSAIALILFLASMQMLSGCNAATMNDHSNSGMDSSMQTMEDTKMEKGMAEPMMDKGMAEPMKDKGMAEPVVETMKKPMGDTMMDSGSSTMK